MADFSELKAAIRQDIKDNTEQEITGDILQGDLLRMVDDINAAKADNEPGKGLSTNDYTDADKEKLDGIPSDICPDVPADAPSPLYGRTPTHEWQPIALVSGLHIELTIPSSANPAEYEIILSYGDGSVRRAIEYVEGGLTLTDIPAGMRVMVNVKPPHNYTAPRSKIYTSQLGVIENYAGTSIYIVDGVYVLDKFGGYTPYLSWDTQNNQLAVGVGYYQTGGDSFVVSKNQASINFLKDGTSLTNQNCWFAGSDEDYVSLGLTVAETQENALLATINNARDNCAILCERHTISQPNWRTDSSVSNPTSAANNSFPAAVCAARFCPCEDDIIGDWFLGSLAANLLCSQNADIRNALTRIGGTIMIQSVFWHSGVTKPTIRAWAYRDNTVFNITPNTSGIIKAFRRF